jgi:hypothetical protein
LSCKRLCAILGGLWFACAWQWPAYALEHLRIDLVRSGTETFPADTAIKNFFFRIPGHISAARGSELSLVMRGSGQLWRGITAVRLAVNGETVGSVSIDARNVTSTNSVLVLAQTAIPEHLLGGGWNRVALIFDQREEDREILKQSSWSISRAEAQVSLAFERLPLFPELRRFPESLAEQRLTPAPIDLRRIARVTDPSVSVLLPVPLRNAHLRGCAIVATRLGQVDYLSEGDCKLATIEHWTAESAVRNGVVIGTRTELPSIPLPDNVMAAIAGLREQEGLLAEIITADATRWVLATGADDTGLEKALLCLGSADALNSLPPSPAVISEAPPKSVVPPKSPTGLKDEPGLQHLHNILVPDPSFRNTAFVLPEKAGIDDARVMFSVAMHLGGQTSESRVRWPEACLNGSGDARIANRRVLFLGPLAEWDKVRLAIRQIDPETVEILGRRHSISSFEPSLALLQLASSPAGGEPMMVFGGGWRSSGGNELLQLFANAAPAGRLFGNLAAGDVAGRVVSFDTRRFSSESFADRLRQHIPPGVSFSETTRRIRSHEAAMARSHKLNGLVFYAGLALMVLLISARLVLSRTARSAVIYFIAATALLGDLRPVPQSGTNTLVIYAGRHPAYSLADGLELLKLQLQHVATGLEVVPVADAVSNDVFNADHLVIFCPQAEPAIASELLQGIASRSAPTLWVGFGMERLQALPRFEGQFEVAKRPADTPLGGVKYRDRAWVAPVYPWLPVALRLPASAVIMSSPENAPLCWRASNFTFFAALPITERVSFLFTDLLFDFYGVQDAPAPRLFLRIEDYSALSDHPELQRKADYLHSRGLPFILAVTPPDAAAPPDFVNALRYAQARGGRLILSGAQAWWDIEHDHRRSIDPVSISAQIQSAAAQFIEQRLFPLAWETPHYSASREAYREVAKVFSTAVERVQLSDSTHTEHGVPLGFTVDAYGRFIVPENLGYVRGPASTNALAEIRSRAEFLLPLRGVVAGCHIHAFQPLSKLVALVELLESFKTPFLDLADLPKALTTPKIEKQ